MSRRKVAQKRDVLPDTRYSDKIVTKFINVLMKDGKKSVAEKIFYGSMEIIKNKTGEDPLKVFMGAIENVKPALEVKSRRVGGATYQVPTEIKPERRLALAFRWIADFSRKRNEKTMVQRLAGELIDAYNKTGSSVKKRDDTHRMAEANKAFAHYKW
ncbi:MAG: 30S ribosomal protein S7 [Nitrospirae bacterium]|nr:MAG: 30S ribosomal protein S7 [Nitrospirota bacterium]